MIGSRQWMEHQHGKLSRREKYKIIQQLIIPLSCQYAERYFKKCINNTQLDIRHIQIPQTALTLAASKELMRCGSNSVIAHVRRCFYWAVALADYRHWKFDPEVLWLACLSHKLGLVEMRLPEYCHCFTYASSLFIERLCQQYHYPERKMHHISNAICLHLNGCLSQRAVQRSYEVLLLQQATAFDTLGNYTAYIPKTYVQQVLQQYPRQQINTEISQLFKQEATRNPDSRTALFCQLGLLIMIQHNGFNE